MGDRRCYCLPICPTQGILANPRLFRSGSRRLRHAIGVLKHVEIAHELKMYGWRMTRSSDKDSGGEKARTENKSRTGSAGKECPGTKIAYGSSVSSKSIARGKSQRECERGRTYMQVTTEICEERNDENRGGEQTMTK